MKILPLAQIEDGQENLVGTKAFSVAKLLQAKILVPEGFVVTSQAFTSFLEENDLQLAIRSELNKVTLGDLHSVDYASRLIQELIQSADVPQELATDIMQQFTHTNAAFVATRSSVFSNHGQALSWTGQLATYLHISPEDLLDHVKKCWASLFSTKALYYLLQHKLQPDQVNLAVLVQRMIDSKTAGICYTSHPVSKDKNQLVIEAGLGLGDANEDRPFTPDTYTLQKDPLSILDKNVSVQEVEIISLGGTGTSIQDIEPTAGAQQKLSDDEIMALAQAAMQAEQEFGAAIMLEWVKSDDFYFLQVVKMN